MTRQQRFCYPSKRLNICVSCRRESRLPLAIQVDLLVGESPRTAETAFFCLSSSPVLFEPDCLLTASQSLLLRLFPRCFYNTHFNVLHISRFGTVLKNAPINASSAGWMLLLITALLKAFLLFSQTTALVCWSWNQFNHRHNGLTFSCLFA